MAEPDEKIERFLRRNLRTVVRQGGLAVPANVELMHGSFVGLKRTGALPAVETLLEWAVDEGLGPDDVLRLDGVASVVAHAERNFGRLTTKAEGDALVLRLTSDEAWVARQALFLLLYGPFCNMRGHGQSEDRDPFWEMHTLTGFWERDFRYLYDALDDRIRPSAAS